tara:strand:+ start:67 stop:828 length:762 start_codon:yes stop_codon:yes gene_type:complete
MIDSHCHLDHDYLFNDINDIIKRSKNAGIKKILTICTTLNSFEKIKEIVLLDEIIFGTCGIHPHETKNDLISTDDIINKIQNNTKIIGVGETGLDFFYNNSEKDYQINSFKKHIEASIALSIPLIIHSRNAEDEIIDILKKYENSNIKILMHCFTGSKKLMMRLLKFNAYFSASGIITFKNSQDLQDTFKEIPLSNLLIETDSPYLAPIPNRGKKNEPSYIKFTAKKLADIKDISYKEIIDNTSKNFNNLFSI